MRGGVIDRDRGGRDSLQLGPTADKLFDALFSAKDCFPFTARGHEKKGRNARSLGWLKRV